MLFGPLSGWFGPLAEEVEGEALPLPVHGDAEAPRLLGDARVEVVFPLPDPRHEGFTAQVMARAVEMLNGE